MAQVVQHFGPHRFGFAGDDALAEAGRLLRHQRRVETAQHHRHAAPAVFAGDFVGAPRRVGFHRQSDGIGGLVEGNALHAVVVEAQFDVRRRQSGQGGDGQRLHLPGAQIPAPGPVAHGRLDQGQPHTARFSGTTAVMGAACGKVWIGQSQV